MYHRLDLRRILLQVTAMNASARMGSTVRTLNRFSLSGVGGSAVSSVGGSYGRGAGTWALLSGDSSSLLLKTVNSGALCRLDDEPP